MDASSLIKLPGELRNRIYELALHYNEGITVRVLTGTPRIDDEGRNQHILALSTTCKQLRHECHSTLYETNRFILVTRPTGQRYNEHFWQKGLRTWLSQISDCNRERLKEVQIDIGTSFMYDLYPSSETVWRSVSALLALFNLAITRVSMRTEVNWMSRSRRSFAMIIPLNDIKQAQLAVREVLKQQRTELEIWSQTMHLGARDVGYRRMELETCGQELRSFVALLETTNATV